MIIFVNIEITIIQTIIFEFENMFLFGMSLSETLCNRELWNFALKKIHKMVQKKIMYRYVSSCSAGSIKHFM